MGDDADKTVKAVGVEIHDVGRPAGSKIDLALWKPSDGLTTNSMCNLLDEKDTKRHLELVAKLARAVDGLSAQEIAFWSAYNPDPQQLRESLKTSGLRFKDRPATMLRQPQILRKLKAFWETHHKETLGLLERTAIDRQGKIKTYPRFLSEENKFTFPIFDPGYDAQKLLSILPQTGRLAFNGIEKHINLLEPQQKDVPRLLFARNTIEPDACHRGKLVKSGGCLREIHAVRGKSYTWMNLREYFIFQSFATWMNLGIECDRLKTIFPDVCKPVCGVNGAISVLSVRRVHEHNRKTTAHIFVLNDSALYMRDGDWSPLHGPREVFDVPLLKK